MGFLCCLGLSHLWKLGVSDLLAAMAEQGLNAEKSINALSLAMIRLLNLELAMWR